MFDCLDLLYVAIMSFRLSIFFLAGYHSYIHRLCLPLRDFNSRFSYELGGQRLDRLFGEGELLGRGGVGEVRSIKWRPTPSVAVKLVEFPSDDLKLESLRMEIGVREKAKGKAVVDELIGCVEERGRVFLVLQKMFGDLRSQHGKTALMNLSKSDRFFLYASLAEKVGLLHSLGIIHEDLKPENLMLVDEEASDLRVVDFGNSVPPGETRLGGSVHFDAPEKSRGGFRPASSKHDVYALGMTLATVEADKSEIFDLVPLKCLRRAKTSRCASQILMGMRTALTSSGVPELVPLIDKASHFLPSKRFKTMRHFAEALRTLAESIGSQRPRKPPRIFRCEWPRLWAHTGITSLRVFETVV